MATFQPRVQSEIVNDALAYIASQTDMTTEVGSFVRSLVEAFAIECDDANYQMVQILDGYSIMTATGSDLDKRAADYDMERLQPAASTTYVVFRDRNLVTSNLVLDQAAGSVTSELASTSAFPVAGYPYNIRIGEGTLQVETVAVSNNNTTTNTLTHGATVNAHSSGERVSRVTGAANIVINAGVSAQVAARGTSPAVVFVTQEQATIANGDYDSSSVLATSQLAGRASNIGASQISEFASGAPFTGAGVTNPSPASGGRDLEADQEFRDRIIDHIRSLSTGNIFALKQAVLGVADDTTGQRVVTANVIEDFVADEVRVLIDDGTGFTPSAVHLPTSTVQVALAIGAATVRVADASDFADEGYVILSPEDAAQIELMEYSAVNRATNTLTFAGVTLNAHDAGDEVVTVEVLDLAAEPGRNFWNLSQFGILRNSERVFLKQGAVFTELANGTDYDLNRAVGQLQIVGSGVAAMSQLVIAYSYYTGLVQLVQRVLNGDSLDPVTYPGVRAAGVEVLAETPTVRRITARMAISALAGFDESILRPLVREAVETYINALGIGNDVLLSEIITAAMNVAGVYNVVVTEPTSDVAILENQLPLPISSSGTSLVTVT
jgi:uncharacterized phage protein gp47/JayE